MSQTLLLRPTVPEPPAGDLPWYRAFAAFRTNAIAAWPAEAYEKEFQSRRLVGRHRLLVNSAAAIHHVLVENHANYRRSPASIRILRPIIGNGLLLSDGEDWRHQRRTIAPALAPRTLPVLARHIVDRRRARRSPRCQHADRTARRPARRHAEPGAGHRRPLDVLAGDAAVTARRCAACCTEYSLSYSRPHLLDMVLPPSIPTLRDLGRRAVPAPLDGADRRR